MKRRFFLERVAQIAAGLGFGAAAAVSLPPAEAAAPALAAEASIAPSAIQQATLTAAVTGTPYGYSDLLQRGIRQVYFSNYAERVIDYEPIFNRFGRLSREPDVVIAGLGRMPRQSYLNRLNRGQPPKRRRM